MSAEELCASCGMPKADCKCSPGTRTRSHDANSSSAKDDAPSSKPAKPRAKHNRAHRLERFKRRQTARKARRAEASTKAKGEKPVKASAPESQDEVTRLQRTVERLGDKIAKLTSAKEANKMKKDKKKSKHRYEADSESSSDTDDDEDGSVSLRKTSPFSKKARSDPIFEYAFRSARRIPRPLPSMVLPAYIKDPYLWICYIVENDVQVDDVVKDRVFQTTAIAFSQEVARLYPNRSADVREQFVRVFVAIVCQVRTASLQMNVMNHRDVWATLENLVAMARSLLSVLQRSKK